MLRVRTPSLQLRLQSDQFPITQLETGKTVKLARGTVVRACPHTPVQSPIPTLATASQAALVEPRSSSTSPFRLQERGQPRRGWDNFQGTALSIRSAPEDQMGRAPFCRQHSEEVPLQGPSSASTPCARHISQPARHGAASRAEHCGGDRFLLPASPRPLPRSDVLGLCRLRGVLCSRRGTEEKTVPPPQQSYSSQVVSPLGTVAGASDLGMAQRGEFHPPPHCFFHPCSLDLLQAMVLTPGGTVQYCTASAALAFWFRGYRNG